MAGPAKKPIRLTLFWSDEAALVQDFNKKHSKKMVDWANAFFGDRYGFVLDVVPDPAGPIKEAYRYTLAKSGGYEPDLLSYDEVVAEWKKARIKPLEDELVAERDIGRLRTREEAKRHEIDLARTQLAAIPPGHTAEREEARTRLDALLGDLLAINESIARLVAELPKLQQKRKIVDLFFEEDFEQRNFDLVQRRALGAKIKEGKNAQIQDPLRLKVLNCRFKIKPSLSFDPPTQPFGITLRPINFNHHNKDYVWDGAFIMINTNRHEPITLAHEAVHAAGHGHPMAFRAKTLAEFARTITMDQAGKLVMPSRLTYSAVEPGYQDGPNNSVMNYNAKGLKPDQAILEDVNKTELEDAFFVKPPP